MLAIKFCWKTIVLCVLTVTVIKCNKMNFSRSASPEIHIHTRQLLGMCFPNELNPVAVTAELIDVVYGIPQNETIESSVIVIDTNFSSEVIKKYYPRHPSFVLPGDSIETLETILREVTSTEIWNVRSLFMIIGTECKNSVPVLKLLWRIEAAASFFFCRNEVKNKTMVYMFNPFSNYAPKPWRQVEFDGEQGQWTLYRQPIKNDARICQSITFDKSRHLDGFPIKGVVTSPKRPTDKTDVFIGEVPSEVFKYRPPINRLLYPNLFSASNSTPVVYNIKPTSFEEQGISFKNRTYDLLLPVVSYKLIPVVYYDLLNFYDQNGYIILTNKQSMVPVINQVMSYFNFWTFSMSCIILIGIFIVIYVSNNQILREALLDMLALFLDRELMVPLDRLSIKIVFFSATLFMLIFNPMFQSHIMSLLIKPTRQQVETLEDLYQNKFHVYYDQKIDHELSMLGLWTTDSDKQYLHKETMTYYMFCEDVLKNSPLNACIMNSIMLDEIPDNMYISKYVHCKKFRCKVGPRDFYTAV